MWQALLLLGGCYRLDRLAQEGAAPDGEDTDTDLDTGGPDDIGDTGGPDDTGDTGGPDDTGDTDTDEDGSPPEPSVPVYWAVGISSEDNVEFDIGEGGGVPAWRAIEAPDGGVFGLGRLLCFSTGGCEIDIHRQAGPPLRLSMSSAGFIVRYGPSGEAVWATPLHDEIPVAGAVTADSRLLVAASPVNAPTIARRLLAYSASGELLWERWFDRVEAITEMGDGSIVVAGSYRYTGQYDPPEVGFGVDAPDEVLLEPACTPGQNGHFLARLTGDGDLLAFEDMGPCDSFRGFDAEGDRYIDRKTSLVPVNDAVFARVMIPFDSTVEQDEVGLEITACERSLDRVRWSVEARSREGDRYLGVVGSGALGGASGDLWVMGNYLGDQVALTGTDGRTAALRPVIHAYGDDESDRSGSWFGFALNAQGVVAGTTGLLAEAVGASSPILYVDAAPGPGGTLRAIGTIPSGQGLIVETADGERHLPCLGHSCPYLVELDRTGNGVLSAEIPVVGPPREGGFVSPLFVTSRTGESLYFGGVYWSGPLTFVSADEQTLTLDVEGQGLFLAKLCE